MAPPLTYQSLQTRILILACFWTALILSIPSWLRLTTIQRLPLPTSHVEALQAVEKCPVTFATHLTLLIDPDLLPPPGQHGDESVLQQVQQLVEQSLQLKASMARSASFECTKWAVDAHSIASVGRIVEFEPDTGTYAIRILTPWSNFKHGTLYDVLPTAFIPRTTFNTTATVTEDFFSLVPHTISAAVIAELLSLRGDSSIESSISDTQQDPRVIQYSKHIRLVFSIMNQDITHSTAYDSHLIHALANTANASHDDDSKGGSIGRLIRELQGLHDFHVETQVQWFAPLQFEPTQELLEEIVEREVEELVMVDELVEEMVEVEVDDIDDDGDQDVNSNSSVTVVGGSGTSEEEEQGAAEVKEHLLTPTLKQRKTVLVKRTRNVQVPRVHKVIKQTRTPLPKRHVVEWDDLKVFVNSEEWSLTSTVPPPTSSSWSSSSGSDDDEMLLGRPFDVLSQTHDLHFLLYIPSKSHSPLHVRDLVNGGVVDGAAQEKERGGRKGAWLIPQWGGVVILNAPHSTFSDSSSSSSSSSLALTSHNADMLDGQGGGARVEDLPEQDVKEAIGLFTQQIEMLLGLTTDSSMLDDDEKDRKKQGGQELEKRRRRRKVRISMLKQRRILELARESVNTLQAITRLVEKIENLGIGEAVQTDTNAALDILETFLNPVSTLKDDDSEEEQRQRQRQVSKSSLDDILEQIKKAYSLSNRAFFNPDMLGLLYFPDEHKYAVYTPLFAPLLVPLIVTTLKLLNEIMAIKTASDKVKRCRKR
ncbi:related to GPI transamidase component PIG-S [Melanopsichium pennsylvanicum]|uniref:Related to GPI transamidase component PIG-S n=1 Tax=Melanopsichium pennsylvanicum TaxID=63383 RepID=A0AAJ4XJY5_9BASI|nr:related to GPI transamidase component PIG-S [Melanopsichium pennsylvanicum]